MSIQQVTRRIDQWWDEQFASGDVDIKRAAEKAEEEFLADPAFCQLVAKCYIGNITYQRGIDLASRRRALIREEGKAIARATPIVPMSKRPTDEWVPPPAPKRPEPVAPALLSGEAPSVEPDPVPTETTSPPAVFETPRVQMTRSWSEWLERDPETGHHVSLKTLTKPKILKKSREYYDRGGNAIQTGALLALVAGRLPDETTQLGDVMSDHDLNLIAGHYWVKLQAEIGMEGVDRSFTWRKLLS